MTLDQLERQYETRFDRLDAQIEKLSELKSSVAKLQEKELKNSEDISVIRQDLRGLTHSVTEGVERVHNRIDQLDVKSESRTKDHKLYVEKHEDEIAEQFKEVYKTMDHGFSELRRVENSHKKFQDIGIGIWIAGSAALGLIQWLGYSYIETVKTDFENLKTTVKVDSNKTAQLEESLKDTYTELRLIKQNLQK